MIDILDETDTFLAGFTEFEEELGEKDAPALRRLRRSARDRFQQLGLPTKKNEDWKFTNVTSLADVPFRPGTPDAKELYGFLAKLPFFLAPHPARKEPAPPGAYCLLRNGMCADCCMTPHLLNSSLVVAPLFAVFKGDWPFAKDVGRIAKYQDSSFTALNTAYLYDGACIYVPKNVVLQHPIHIVYVSLAREEPTVSHPRALVVMGENSQATLVETFIGPEGQTYFTNAVTEVLLAENAVLDHYKVQRESSKAFHIATTAVHQSRSSNFSTHYIGLGGRLVRNEVHVELAGEGCEATVNGLYLASGMQHMDNFTVIDHAKPHCASHELYKGILDGKAHGVFNGKIFVRQDAQKTDAKQTNQTLLLSDDATINTKPQLEIFADDVKCTHGATVGQLDADAIFYLRSRGLGHAEARALLTFAFANDIVGRIKVAPVREQLEAALLASHRLPAEASAKEKI